jgi:hypothetical protein
MKIRKGCAEEEVGGRTQKQGTDKKGSKRNMCLLMDLNFVLFYQSLLFTN